MKLTDYVVDVLAREGVRHVFGLTGGAVVHLYDSAARHPDLQPVFTHHEQAGSFAAEAYAKIRNGLGACFVTTGPGVTNAVTGLATAWQDSVPCVFVSGQSRLAHTTHGKGLRQLGTQELDIIPVVQSLTKYAVMIDDISTIRYHLEKAIYLAKSGRPGPVWLDIPLDMQWSPIEPSALKSFDPAELRPPADPSSGLPAQLEKFIALLNASQRPLVLAGYGVRLAGAGKDLLQFVEARGIPFVTSWQASDLCSTDHPLYVGRPGVAGQRGANLAVQNCDLLISVGSHLSIAITGTLFKAFARAAKKVMVDLDAKELAYQTVEIDLPIRADAGEFFRTLLGPAAQRITQKTPAAWRDQAVRYARYNLVPAEWRAQKDRVHQYVFIDELSRQLTADDQIVVDGGGTNVYISFQAFRLKLGQRLIMACGTAPMGSGIPESVGACFAANKRRTICTCGDGSFQLNVQDLQTIVHHKLPIKLFVFNNEGYVSIRNTQDDFLDGHHVGSEAAGGMSLPDISAVARAYGLKTQQIRSHAEMSAGIANALSHDGPIVTEVFIAPDQKVQPVQGFYRLPDGTIRARPLEDMFPLLDREEFKENMLIPLWEVESKS